MILTHIIAFEFLAGAGEIASTGNDAFSGAFPIGAYAFLQGFSTAGDIEPPTDRTRTPRRNRAQNIVVRGNEIEIVNDDDEVMALAAQFFSKAIH